MRVCGYEKYITEHLSEIEEQEILQRDREILKQYQKEINDAFRKNINELHNKFYDYWEKKYPDYKLNFQMFVVIKEFVDFLKQNV